MTVFPEVRLTHLNRADGSATYSHNGYTLIGAVNGPVEVQRRDEQAEEATLEVNIRPASGMGSPQERHLETLVYNTLRSIILTRLIPRTLVQITLQVKSLPDEHASTGINSSLAILPHLLHTAMLSLLSASIPLRTILTSVLIAVPVSFKSSYLLSPTANEMLRAKPIRSVHVFAFSGDRQLLLNESDGKFSYGEWADVCEKAEELCSGEEEKEEEEEEEEEDDDDDDDDEGGVRLDEGEAMEIDGQQQKQQQQQELSLEQWLRGVARKKVEWEQRWRTAA